MTDPTTRYPIPDDPGPEPVPTDPAAIDAAPAAAPSAATPPVLTDEPSVATADPTPPPTADPTPTTPPPPASRIEAGPAPVSAAWTPPKRDEGRWPAVIFGLILLAVGLWFFAEVTLGIDLPRIRWGQLWPLILIGIGALILFGSRLGRSR